MFANGDLQLCFPTSRPTAGASSRNEPSGDNSCNDSNGGGTRRYSRVNGDVPICLKSSDIVGSTFANVGRQVDEKCKQLVIYCKNVQSIQTEARLQQLLIELGTIQQWDAILLNETWREHKGEQFETKRGHLFMASGGTKWQKGVSIILHRKWKRTVTKFLAINERLCYMNCSMGEEDVTLIALYMPHGSCQNNEVEQIYTLLSGVDKKARQERRIAMVCGDWNAVSRKRLEAEDARVIGDYGIGARNARGSWLLHWAISERMSLL